MDFPYRHCTCRNVISRVFCRIFTARRNASVVLGVVILSVRLSVLLVFCHPTVVGGRRPLPPLVGDRSDPPPFKNRSRRQISACSVSTVTASEKKFNYDE